MRQPVSTKEVLSVLFGKKGRDKGRDSECPYGSACPYDGYQGVATSGHDPIGRDGPDSPRTWLLHALRWMR